MKKVFCILIICCLTIIPKLAHAICSQSTEQQPLKSIEDKQAIDIPGVSTFYEKTGEPILTENHKPVIYLFSTAWCPHCQWTAPIFDKVVKDYLDQEKINAYHWQIDTGDNALTEEIETQVPEIAQHIFRTINPSKSIPVLIFGGKFYRIGSGRASSNVTDDEEKEFRSLIDYLIVNSSNGNVKTKEIVDFIQGSYGVDEDGIIHFGWQPPVSGPADYYNVYVAVDPEDPLNPEPEEFALVVTTIQPFFDFLGEANRVYVLQTQAVYEYHWLVIVNRDNNSPNYHIQKKEIKKDSFITIENFNDQNTRIFVDTIKDLGLRSDYSEPVRCLKTNTHPEIYNIYIKIP